MPPQSNDDSNEKFNPDAGSQSSRLRGELDQVKRIATGGMAHIFRARQPSLDRFIAIKKLREELVVQAELLERFRREAKALASVLHQNVAHVYDFVESGRESYILMEFIEGIDVSDAIEKLGSLPPDVAASILLGVARGVNYIHTHHLIHRDIKPSNIRLNTRGEVKLMDFGIVMDIDNAGLTRPGMMVGSPSYLSPEQVLGDTLSPRADIFLMGICLYEMLTGTRPFKEDGHQTIFQKIREANYVPARKMNRKIPADLDKIIAKCLRRDPEKRYADVRSVMRDLEEFLGPVKASHTEEVILKFLDSEALLNPSVPVIDFEDEAAVASGFKLLKWVGVAAIGIALTFFGYWLGSRGQKAQPVGNFPPPRSSN